MDKLAPIAVGLTPDLSEPCDVKTAAATDPKLAVDRLVAQDPIQRLVETAQAGVRKIQKPEK